MHERMLVIRIIFMLCITRKEFRLISTAIKESKTILEIKMIILEERPMGLRMK